MDSKSQLIVALVVVTILLTIILVPLSFSYVEYYEYGLSQRKTTGAVDPSRVYVQGRYALGPDYKFIKYQADAHVEVLRGFSIFSAGESQTSIGLDFLIDVDFTFLLNRQDIGRIHQESASSYRTVIVSRAKDALKNEASQVTFTEYFQNRTAVEARFRQAVQTRWDSPPSLQCTLDQFHLGRIQIPETVAQKQLQAKIQNERNDQEAFLQQAQIEREQTAVQTNTIALQQQAVLRTAEAEASLIRSMAQSEAAQIVAAAQINGTKALVAAAAITQQEQITAMTYIRTLHNRGDVKMTLHYLTDENIVKTSAV